MSLYAIFSASHDVVRKGQMKYPNSDMLRRRIASYIALICLVLTVPILPSLLGADASAARTSHQAAELRYRTSAEQITARQWSETSEDWPTATNGNLTGLSVAVSGNTAVVAAPGAAANAGTAYIYERSGAKWRRVKILSDPRAQPHDFYAWAVAITKTKTGVYYIAVGGNDTNTLQDLVYIYTGSGRTWHLQTTLSDPGNDSQDMYGDTIAITGSTLVVGATCYNTFSGDVWIYERSGRHWALQADKVDPNNHAYDEFGGGIAISGNDVLISGGGVIYDYVRNSSNTWPLRTTIHNPGEPINNFGTAVAASGTTAVIGAPGPPSPLSAGAACVFRRSGGAWVLRQKLTQPRGFHGMKFGYSIAVTTTGMLIGMPIYGAVDCGTAFLARPSGSRWVVRRQVKNPACTANDQFGFAVAISGSTGVFGAPHTNNDSGSVYFKLFS